MTERKKIIKAIEAACEKTGVECYDDIGRGSGVRIDLTINLTPNQWKLFSRALYRELWPKKPEPETTKTARKGLIL